MQIHSPEAVGMSAERLIRLSSHMAQLTADNQRPGIMTLIQRKGKVVHLGKHGLMDIEAGKPIDEDTIFRIQSMTKPIIAVAVLMLLEEGRLALNDPVARYIPAFADLKVETDDGLVAQNPSLSVCPSGGGGLVSTIGDYLAFCNCLINNGRHADGRLLSRKSIALMTANHLPAALLPTSLGPTMRGYGLGVQVTSGLSHTTLLSTPGQYIWGGAATTIFYVDPAEELIAILMTQLAARLGWRLMTELFPNLVYQAVVD